MFADFPKIFEKNFIIGFFIPSLILSFCSTWLPTFFEIDSFSWFKNINSFLEMTIIIFIIWVIGILLMVCNRSIIRSLEGYGRFNIFRIIKWIEVRQFQKIKTRLMFLENRELDLDNPLTEKENSELTKISYEFVRNFPDEIKWVLPTQFGNILRAFEVYSRIMYGAEAIIMWPRLQTVIPEDYNKIIESNKANVNFWVNLSLITTILYMEALGLLICTSNWVFEIEFVMPIVLILFLFVADLFSYHQTLNCSYVWGESIKSAFDVYLPELSKKMGLEIPSTSKEKIKVWNDFRRAVQFVKPTWFPKRKETTLKDVSTSIKDFFKTIF